MLEIEFSYIRDYIGDTDVWPAIMDEFRAQRGVQVHLREMTWDTAWLELFSFGSNDKGPQVSHIGNTWVSSLARMNVLRPFTVNEISAVGGAWDFITPNWETGLLPGDKRVWAIPWTAWIYVICSRNDLLEKVGIDPSDAFGTIQANKATINHLAASSLEVPWLNAQLPVSYRDLLHIAASWIWAAGGDFFDKNGTKALFNSAQAIDGLKDWLEIYRAVPAQYKKLTQEETFDMFRQGRAAAVLTDIRTANGFIGMEDNPSVRDHLAISSVTDVPWTGGGSFVIWDHARSNPSQEKAAVDLVQFLASKEMNIRYQHAAGSMPSRMDALHEIYPQGNPAREAVMRAATKGRGYYNISIWRRIEQQLSDEMGSVIHEAVEDVSADSVTMFHTHLDGLAERVNNMLK